MSDALVWLDEIVMPFFLFSCAFAICYVCLEYKKLRKRERRAKELLQATETFLAHHKETARILRLARKNNKQHTDEPEEVILSSGVSYHVFKDKQHE